MEQKKKRQEAEDDPTRTKRQKTICEECKEKPSKYKCPGCSLRSCSLPCVNSHKQRTGCSGKRNTTHFVPLSQFDDNLLLSDYNLLEEIKRVSESAQRLRTKLRAYPQFKLPFYLQSLRRAAADRRTKLLLLPSGMSKRENNQSRYDHRKKFISWTIEWRFHSTDAVLLDHGVHEDTNLSSVIEKHLKPGPWNHQLRQFCEENLSSLKFFIRQNFKGLKSPFWELDIKAPLKQQLANVVILEYPVIHVFLPSHGYDFEVVKAVRPVNHGLENKNSNDHPCLKEVAFREEEIEDNGSSDPQVYDLMKNDPLSLNIHHFMSEKRLSESSNSILSRVAGSTTSPPSSKSLEQVNEFNFDQGLIDVYSDLIAEINPDDFLDLESEFIKEEEVEKRKDISDSAGIFLVGDELEEGEIF